LCKEVCPKAIRTPCSDNESNQCQKHDKRKDSMKDRKCGEIRIKNGRHFDRADLLCSHIRDIEQQLVCKDGSGEPCHKVSRAICAPNNSEYTTCDAQLGAKCDDAPKWGRHAVIVLQKSTRLSIARTKKPRKILGFGDVIVVSWLLPLASP
jgi:hypothetical protein